MPDVVRLQVSASEPRPANRKADFARILLLPTMGPRIPSPSSVRAITIVALVVMFGALAGSRYSDSLSRAGRVVASEAISSEIAQFEAVIAAIEESSADASDLESAVMKGAIPQMLANLDPHSQFFEPTPFVRLREEQAGTYAGVGMQIAMFEGAPIIEHPFPGTPAFQAGVRPGDVIRTVDGQRTQGRALDEVVDLVAACAELVRLGLERDGQRGLVEVDDPRRFRARFPWPFFAGIGLFKSLHSARRLPMSSTRR
jgi:C-terminal processing protease CtpA/Prc